MHEISYFEDFNTYIKNFKLFLKKIIKIKYCKKFYKIK